MKALGRYSDLGGISAIPTSDRLPNFGRGRLRPEADVALNDETLWSHQCYVTIWARSPGQVRACQQSTENRAVPPFQRKNQWKNAGPARVLLHCWRIVADSKSNAVLLTDAARLLVVVKTDKLDSPEATASLWMHPTVPLHRECAKPRSSYRSKHARYIARQDPRQPATGNCYCPPMGSSEA